MEDPNFVLYTFLGRYRKNHLLQYWEDLCLYCPINSHAFDGMPFCKKKHVSR